jgi:hypothetical protein
MMSTQIRQMIDGAGLAREDEDSGISTEDGIESHAPDLSADNGLPKLFRCSGFSQPGFLSQANVKIASDHLTDLTHHANQHISEIVDSK